MRVVIRLFSHQCITDVNSADQFVLCVGGMRSQNSKQTVICVIIFYCNSMFQNVCVYINRLYVGVVISQVFWRCVAAYKCPSLRQC